MLHFIYRDGTLAEVTDKFPQYPEPTGMRYMSRHDFPTLDTAARVAADASALTGDLHIATDAGPHHYPRYDVIRAPKVGDAVSYSFNGDTYPCGHIARISDTLRKVTTTTGETFFRRRESGTWLHGKTWALVRGHVNERNPHF